MGRKQTKKTVKQLTVYLLIFCLLFNSSLSVVFAGAVNPVVEVGSATLVQNGNTTTITTATNHTVIRSDSFDVLHNEFVNIMQPNSGSNTMNKISSARPTALNGTITSNGGVYWLNPAGVIIGEGAVINATKFVASAMNMSNSDFVAGIDRFTGGHGVVINEGDINAQSVYLVAKQVINTGRIISPNGHVVLASGDRVFISEPSSKILVEVDAPAVGSDLPMADMADVTNEGAIEAAGGKIILAAAGDMLSSPMMSNLGTLSTSVDQGDAGNISLQAVNGQVENTGLITAQSDSGTGGTVTAEGARVGNFGTINVDSADGDGGNINLTADEVAVLGRDSLTTANAGTNGDGGDIVVYSADTALFREGALVEAKGGNESGDGGFFELSGKEYVEVVGGIDLTAANGNAGEFLIDPRNIKIVDELGDPEEGSGTDPWVADWATSNSDYAELDIDILEDYLDYGDLTISTLDATYSIGDDIYKTDQSGWIVFDAGRDIKDGAAGGSNNSLTVNADDYISFESGSGINFTGSGNVTLNAGTGITVNTDLTLASGAFGAYSGLAEWADINVNASIIAGSIRMTAYGDSSGRGVLNTMDLSATSGSISLKGRNVTVDGSVDAGNHLVIKAMTDGTEGGDGVIDTAGTLQADGSIVIAVIEAVEGLDDEIIDSSGQIILGDNVTAIGGNLTLHNNTDVAAYKTLQAGNSINLVSECDTLNGTSELTLDAKTGQINQGTATITVSGSELIYKQFADLDMAGRSIGNKANTDVTLQSYDGYVKDAVADDWGSVTATAMDNIELEGSDDVKIGGSLYSYSGGVSVVSSNGKIYTPGSGDMLNVGITGNSDGIRGVDLPDNIGKAAIVLMSEDTLKLGSSAVLTANGLYDTTGTLVDDRSAVDFLDHDIPADEKLGGVPIDIAIYTASTTGDVHLGSQVNAMPDGAAMVVDAHDTVTFGTAFEVSRAMGNVGWLEACSRISQTFEEAQNSGSPRLPYVDVDPTSLPLSSLYVPRGENPDVGTGAWVLVPEPPAPIKEIVQAALIDPPSVPDIGDIGKIEGAGFEGLAWLAEELELCQGDEEGGESSRCQEMAQAYLEGSFMQATDLKPYQAVTRLRDLVETLHDSDGSSVAALVQVVNEFSQPDAPPSPEQFASIAQAFDAHANDGTHYATAGKWLDTLTEYVEILNTDIGWEPDESIAFIMGKYGTAITESGDIGVMAFVQMQLEGMSG